MYINKNNILNKQCLRTPTGARNVRLITICPISRVPMHCCINILVGSKNQKSWYVGRTVHCIGFPWPKN